jgi:hypothetical protein
MPAGERYSRSVRILNTVHASLIIPINMQNPLYHYIGLGRRNSPFNFMLDRNKGMRHMLGETWMELFDVVVTSARKPSFYQRTDRYIQHVVVL